MTVYGDGTQTRSFCYVDDLIEGLIQLMNSDCQAPVNLGNPDEKAINEIAEIISGLVNVDCTIEYFPLPVDDPVRRCPDISRARQTIGWEPKIALNTGIRNTIDWFVTNQNETKSD